MRLVTVSCTQCGAIVQVDSTKDAAVCEFCSSAFIVEKAINNYNITGGISAHTVNVYNTTQNEKPQGKAIFVATSELSRVRFGAYYIIKDNYGNVVVELRRNESHSVDINSDTIYVIKYTGDLFKKEKVTAHANDITRFTLGYINGFSTMTKEVLG